LNGQHPGKPQLDRNIGRRHRRAPNGERRQHRMPLTADGFPAATAEVPKPSPAVLVSDDSRARYPWLPARVIAGSVWRGPRQERVRVDETGNATP
jgi:hypothetical protein